MSNNMIPKKGDSMFDRIDNFMKDSFLSAKNFISPEVIAVDVKDKKTFYEVDLELPGVLKENVGITLQDGYLTVSVEKKYKTEDGSEAEGYLHRERFFGNSSRSIYLKDVANDAKATAKLENGVLEITVPKSEEVLSVNKIEIE